MRSAAASVLLVLFACGGPPQAVVAKPQAASAPAAQAESQALAAPAPPTAVDPEVPDGVTMHRIAAGTPDATGWYAARSAAGRFEILLPGPFNDFTVEDSTSRAECLGTLLATGVKFGAFCIWTQRPSASALESLASLDGVTAKRELEVDHHPALEVEAGTKAMLRAIAYADHFCLLTAEAQSPSAALSMDDAKKMFASFRYEP